MRFHTTWCSFFFVLMKTSPAATRFASNVVRAAVRAIPVVALVRAHAGRDMMMGVTGPTLAMFIDCDCEMDPVPVMTGCIEKSIETIYAAAVAS